MRPPCTTAVVSPIIGLFRRRPQPTSVEKMKLERYSSTPVSGANEGWSNDGTETVERRSKDVSIRPTSNGLPRGGRRRAPNTETSIQKGGCHHG